MVLKQASISSHKILFPSFVVKYVWICFYDFHPITDLIPRKTTRLNTDIEHIELYYSTTTSKK